MADWYAELHRGDSKVNRDGEVTATRTFRLFTGNAASRPTWGVASIAIFKYDPHPDDSRLLAIDVNSTAMEGELGWFDVLYTYTNRPFDVGTTDGTGDPGKTDPTVQPNPVLRTPTCTWSTNSRMVPLEEDYGPVRLEVTNSAGQKFEGLEVEAINGITTIAFNLAGGVDVATKQMAYVNTINDAPFAPIPAHGPYAAGSLRCNKWNGNLQFEAGYGWYTACEVEFEFKRGGWSIDVIDAGFYQRVNRGGGNYVEERIIDPTSGQPVDAPVKLNGNGQRLEPGKTAAELGFPEEYTAPGRYWVKNSGSLDVTVFKRFFPYEPVTWVNIFS